MKKCLHGQRRQRQNKFCVRAEIPTFVLAQLVELCFARSIIMQTPYTTSVPFSSQNLMTFSDSEPSHIQTFMIPSFLQVSTVCSVTFEGITTSTMSGSTVRFKIVDDTCRLESPLRSDLWHKLHSLHSSDLCMLGNHIFEDYDSHRQQGKCFLDRKRPYRFFVHLSSHIWVLTISSASFVYLSL
jgi:hypothetical protein